MLLSLRLRPSFPIPRGRIEEAAVGPLDAFEGLADLIDTGEVLPAQGGAAADRRDGRALVAQGALGQPPVIPEAGVLAELRCGFQLLQGVRVTALPEVP